MKSIPFVDLVTQHANIQTEINNAIEPILSRCDFILGSKVEEFEQAFARFIGTEYAIGVSSGLDALRLVLMALDVGSGDEVILPANTYIATALAVSAVGARPVLVDCEPKTYNVDVSLVEPAITPRTKAVIPVHLTGQSADMDPILEVADRHGLYVVEDAAQAHGTLYKGRSCGSIGIAGCFSFYPGKNLGGCGDGGMVTTYDAQLAERLRRLRNYGQQSKYRHVEKGLNARLDTLQAAVLMVKLRHLPQWNEARAKHAEEYKEMLAGVGDLVFQRRVPYSTHIYHLFIVETKQRDALQKHLTSAGVGTGIHYPVPIHLQQAYADLGYSKGDFPEAEQLAERMLSLPMFPELQKNHIWQVADTIEDFFSDSLARRRKPMNENLEEDQGTIRKDSLSRPQHGSRVVIAPARDYPVADPTYDGRSKEMTEEGSSQHGVRSDSDAAPPKVIAPSPTAGLESAAPSSTHVRSHNARCSVVVIGAGPYGLSAAAHLMRAGVSVRVFGEPMESWAHHMPAGMVLRSSWQASHIADPDHALGLGSYETEFDLERADPPTLARFVRYGRWFQEHAVPGLERRRVSRVFPDPHGFRVELDEGETLRTERVVIAAGIVPFAWRPPQFAGLPPELVSHTVDHCDLSVFESRRVAIVGAGQSALESAALLAEAGAEPEVLVRERDIYWLPDWELIDDSGLLWYAHRKTHLGGYKSSWLVASPGLWRRLPNRTQEPLFYRITKPGGAAWLKPRLSQVPITTGRSISSASPNGDELVLKLDDGSMRTVEHLLLATGYRVDLARYAFLAPELVGRVRTRNGTPVLAAGFESSVPGLHFLGAPAAQDFGPVMRFVCGTWASARELTRGVVGRRAPRAGFSW